MDDSSELRQEEPNYLDKMPFREVWRWWLGTFIGIAGLGFAHFNIPDGQAAFALISAFGASAVLVFGNRRHFFAQPRSLVGGHVLSAFIGVLSFKLLYGHPWLAASVGTATAIAVMQVTRTLHPPGGATALFAV
ncbi:MAG: HPP family protein, partial [Desulfomonile tiedjei]|nr:HPP family protein [Desulfomonile tiedjei]